RKRTPKKLARVKRKDTPKKTSPQKKDTQKFIHRFSRLEDARIWVSFFLVGSPPPTIIHIKHQKRGHPKNERKRASSPKPQLVDFMG
ncbi:MAG: hypothetical protein D6808_02175, partial [Candidatus Dadabacteria bacterium]